jgi:hypothetical protein
MEIDPVAAGDEGERLGHVGAQFIDRAGPAGVAPGNLEAAPGQAPGLFLEAADVVALPTVERYGDRLQTGQGFVRVDA